MLLVEMEAQGWGLLGIHNVSCQINSSRKIISDNRHSLLLCTCTWHHLPVNFFPGVGVFTFLLGA